MPRRGLGPHGTPRRPHPEELGPCPVPVPASPLAAHRPQASALRKAAQSFKAGDLAAFHETLAVASFREQRVGVTLARPQDPDCPLIGMSEGFEAMTGYSRSECLGRNCRFLNVGCPISAEDRHAMRMAVRTGRSFTGVLQNRRRDGEIFRNLLHMSALRIGTSVYILGIQSDVTNIEVDLAKEETLTEIRNVIDAIYAVNVNAWAAMQISRFGAVKLGHLLYAENMLRPHCDPERYVRARDAFVSLELGLLQNHVQDKNTFLEVYDTDDDPKTYLMGLRRVYSEPAIAYSSHPERDSVPQAAAADPERAPSPADDAALPKEEPPSSLPPPAACAAEAAGSPEPSGDEGPLKSVGSAKHPDACTACSFHCYSMIGCNRGFDCQFCHMDHPRRRRRRRRGGRKQPWAEKDGWASPGSSSEDSPVPGALSQPLDPSQELPPTMWSQQRAPQQAKGPASHIPPAGLLPLLSSLELLAPLPPPAALSKASEDAEAEQSKLKLDYSEAVITVTVGQWRNVLPFVSGPPQLLKFSVWPELPRGIRLDPVNGVISGVAHEASFREQAMEHTVFAEGPDGRAFTTVYILVVDPPAEASGRQAAAQARQRQPTQAAFGPPAMDSWQKQP